MYVYFHLSCNVSFCHLNQFKNTFEINFHFVDYLVIITHFFTSICNSSYIFNDATMFSVTPLSRVLKQRFFNVITRF